MKIAFDAKRYFHNSSGLGNYSRTLVDGLKSKYASELELNLLDKPNGAFPWWRSYGLGKAASKWGADIFHGLSNEIPFDLPTSIKTVVTIHDVLFKSRPDDYPFLDTLIYDFKTQYALKRADIVIATSEFTASQIKKYYTSELDKYYFRKRLNIKVLYQSISTKYSSGSWVPDLEFPYFIYHSSFVSRKNHLNLINAFSKVCHLFPHNLILAGKGNLEQDLRKLVEGLNLTDRVLFYQYPSDEQLEKLLIQSSGFIYPSFSEGFGIPLVEAATIGIPMAISKIPVFQELINGVESVIWFDPKNVTDISQSILQLVQSKHPDYNILLTKMDATNISNQYYELYQSLLD